MESLETFTIAGSVESSERRASIPPDLATCPECLAEIFDPTNRRYRYAFTNCTHCGPRFTIANDIPYDRGRTTMARVHDVRGVPARIRRSGAIADFTRSPTPVPSAARA